MHREILIKEITNVKIFLKIINKLQLNISLNVTRLK
jgi:hypothetical protein